MIEFTLITPAAFSEQPSLRELEARFLGLEASQCGCLAQARREANWRALETEKACDRQYYEDLALNIGNMEEREGPCSKECKASLVPRFIK